MKYGQQRHVCFVARHSRCIRTVRMVRAFAERNVRNDESHLPDFGELNMISCHRSADGRQLVNEVVVKRLMSEELTVSGILQRLLK